MLLDTKQAVIHPRIPASYWDRDYALKPILTLYTDEIWIRSKVDGEKYYIGKFRIVLYPSQSSKYIFLENLDNAKSAWAHPHCGQGFKPCIGLDFHIWLTKYLAERDYETVIELLLVFLESYNPKDRNSPYKLWLLND